MSRKPFLRIVTVVLAVGVLLCLSSSPVFAAPPLPSAPSPPTAPPVPPGPPFPYPAYHLVQWGETLTKIARYYGTTVWAIAQANGIWNINYIRAGQWLLRPVSGPSPAPRIYIVQPGDTLSGIAWHFGTTVWAIAQANGIWNPNFIYIGQTLYIA